MTGGDDYAVTEAANDADGFPPTDFVQTDSAVPGIDVYMPTPPEPEAREAVVDFKCPQCGGTTAFGAADGGGRRLGHDAASSS